MCITIYPWHQCLSNMRTRRDQLLHYATCYTLNSIAMEVSYFSFFLQIITLPEDKDYIYADENILRIYIKYLH